MKKQTLALFDFDGTLTKKDSMIEFLFYCHGKKAVYSYFIKRIFSILAYKVKLLDGEDFKQQVFKDLYPNWTKDEMWAKGRQFSKEVLPTLVLPFMSERLQWHKAQGHRIIIVSASIDIWLQDWCDALDLELIATKLAFKERRFTGYFEGPNCNGNEKVKRINEVLQLADYEVYGYGNSSGDKPFLNKSDYAFYKPKASDF